MAEAMRSMTTAADGESRQGTPRLTAAGLRGALPDAGTRLAPCAPKATATSPHSLVQVIGLENDRNRLVFDGVVLNGMCSLKKLGLRNVSSRGTVVVRLGSTLGDQLRWQLRNDNLNALPADLQHLATNTVSAISRMTDLPESNATFDSVGLISEVTLKPGETKDIIAAFRPDSTHFLPPPTSTSNWSLGDAGAAGKTTLDAWSEQGLSSISIAESSRSSSAAASSDKRASTTHALTTIDGFVNLDACLLPSDAASIRPSADGPTMLEYTDVQQLSVELHATCCRSFFTLSARDTDTPNATGSAGPAAEDVYVDFGSCRVGDVHTRDCDVSNRSAVELFWRIDGLPAHFQLEDLETGSVVSPTGFASVPPYSTRRLRFSYRPPEPTELDEELTVENVADPENIVQIHFHGTVTSAPLDNTLKIVSGASLDFGDCCGGEWSQQVVSFVNISGAPLEVSFSAEKGQEVGFRLQMSNVEDESPAPFDLDRAAIGANAVDLPATPTTPEPLPSRDLSTAPSRTIIHELARGTTKTTQSGQRSGLLAMAGGRPLVPRSPPSIQSDQTFASSDPSEPVSDSYFTASDTSAPRTYLPTTRPNRDFRSPLGATSVISEQSGLAETPTSQGDARISAVLRELGGDGAAGAEPPASSRAATSSVVRTENSERGLFRVTDHLKNLEQRQSTSVDQIHAKPGITYRIIVSYRPARATSFESDGGRLSKKNFRVHVSWRPWGTRSAAASVPNERKSINCKARVCTSFISVKPSAIDFGEVELGTSVQGTIAISNLSEIPARVDLRFISKVLSAYRDEIEIEVGKTVEVKVDMVPRRTNPSYQKQVSVHNLFNPDNSQVCLIKAANVDTRGVAFHSLFYRLLTPTGGNFVEFGSVPVNSVALRAITIQNTSLSPLALDLSPEHPVDYQLLLRKTDDDVLNEPELSAAASTPPSPTASAKDTAPKVNGELKERVLEAIFQQPAPAARQEPPKAPSSATSSTTSRANRDSLATQLKEGDKGKPTHVVGNSVAFKDRGLLASADYLDLAAGPPVRRGSPRAKRTLQADPVERGTSKTRPQRVGLHSKLSSGAKSPVVAQLDDPFHAAQSTSLASSALGLDDMTPKLDKPPPTTPNRKKVARKPDTRSTKASSPALTARRRTRNVLPLLSDPSKLSLDEVLATLEHHSGHPDTSELSSSELEDAYVRKYLALRRTLKNAMASGELFDASSVLVAPQSERTIYILLHPSGSRSTVGGTSRKQDGKISIHLRHYAQPTTPGAADELPPSSEVPIREVVLRWSTFRSSMDLGMAHINFGQLEKSSSKTKKIFITNTSEAPLLYAVRKSGSIASGDIKLAEGRHGVIAGYGKREVSIIFEPHFAGAFEETIHVDNVEDESEGQTVRVKAFILRPATFSVSVTALDFGECAVDTVSKRMCIAVTNISSRQRTFSVALDLTEFSFARAALDVILDPSTTTSKVRGPLSAEEEEEVENVLQKLKISRRKGQPEKEEKYISRLNLLGVPVPAGEPAAAAPTSEAKEIEGEKSAAQSESTNGEAATSIVDASATGDRGVAETLLSAVDALSTPSTPNVPTDRRAPSGQDKSTVTFTLEPNSRRELAVVVVPRLVLPALDDGKQFEAVSAPVTVAENADSKAIVTLRANVALCAQQEVVGGRFAELEAGDEAGQSA